jgi:UDP-N-acetyl-2-amino-2-deoxyglucuronate dehydrogenase
VTLGFGIVGCGGAALDVVRAIDALPDVRLAAAHDRDAVLAADLAGRRGGTVHAELDGLLADPAVDVVYVALPHDLLAPVARRALLAGRHALVEKPMALALDDVRDLDRLARAGGRTLGVMFELRQVASVRAARDLVRAGAIGSIESVRVRVLIDKPSAYWQAGPTGRVSDDWRGRIARAGGGVVLMNGIHHLDLVAFLTDDRLVRASAEIGRPPDAVEVETAAVGALRLGRGALVSFAASAHSAGARAEERIEIDGTLGRIDLPDPYTPDGLRLLVRRPWDGHPADRWQAIAPDPVDPHVAALAAFATAAQAGRPASVGAPEAGAALAAVLAMYASASSGRAVDIEPF